MFSNLPLFSFLVVCYNQEKYIAEALESALRQDYPNLEVIVSDDCSIDNTFKIANEIANEYSGPHKIILNRNTKNLGIGANFYKAYTLSSGKWLFMAAGDDISYSDRASITLRILREYPDCYAINTAREIIDANGHSKGYSYWNESLLGASTAWDRKLFTDFPPIGNEIMSEDLVMQFRAFLLGSVVKSSAVTTKYRVHGDSVSRKKIRNMLELKQDYLRRRIYFRDILKTRMNDLKVAKPRLTDHAKFDEIGNDLKTRFELNEQVIMEHEVTVKILKGNMKDRLRYLCKGDTGIHSSLLYRARLLIYILFDVDHFRENKYSINIHYEESMRSPVESMYSIDDYLKSSIEVL